MKKEKRVNEKDRISQPRRIRDMDVRDRKDIPVIDLSSRLRAISHIKYLLKSPAKRKVWKEMVAAERKVKKKTGKLHVTLKKEQQHD